MASLTTFQISSQYHKNKQVFLKLNESILVDIHRGIGGYFNLKLELGTYGVFLKLFFLTLLR